MQRTSILLVFLAIMCETSLLGQTTGTAGPERGTLVLDGGGAILFGGPGKPALMHKFVQLAGGPRARIVVIPSAWRDDQLTPEGLDRARARAQDMMGIEHVTVMHTRDRKQADSPEFVAPLRQATGVWIPGGKDAYLIDAYVDTRVEAEIKALLERGGVVGGMSAGAAIQGALDTEGTVVDSAESASGKSLRVHATRRSWGLLANATVMPHWSQRNRPDLTPVLAAHPGLLGLALMKPRLQSYKATSWKSSAMVTWAFMTARFTATNPITIYHPETASISTRGLRFRPGDVPAASRIAPATLNEVARRNSA